MKDILQRLAGMERQDERQEFSLDGLRLKVGNSDVTAAETLIRFVNAGKAKGVTYGVAEACLVGELIEAVGEALKAQECESDFLVAMRDDGVRLSLEMLFWFRFHQCLADEDEVQETADGQG